MFLLFGFGLKRRSLGAGHTRTCQRCHNTTQWARMQQYKHFSVFYIPLARWKRTEFEECGICGAAVHA